MVSLGPPMGYNGFPIPLIHVVYPTFMKIQIHLAENKSPTGP